MENLSMEEQVKIIQELNDEIVSIAEECLDYLSKIESIDKDRLSNLEKYVVTMLSNPKLKEASLNQYINKLNGCKVTSSEIILNTFEVSKAIPEDIIEDLKTDLHLLKNIYNIIANERSRQ